MSIFHWLFIQAVINQSESVYYQKANYSQEKTKEIETG